MGLNSPRLEKIMKKLPVQALAILLPSAQNEVLGS
jgi:hypothetical protein